jgi:hypothetical protein
MVAEQKKRVLEKLLSHTDAFREASDNKVDCFERLLEGETTEQVGGLALHYPAMIKEAIHAEPHGRPLEADKSNFTLFIQNLGLPKNHHYIVEGKELFRSHLADWAEVCLDRSQFEADEERREAAEDPISEASIAIRRMLEFCIALGVPEDHDCLIDAENTALAVRGNAVLRHAKALLHQDEAKQSTGENGDAALAAAQDIEANVKSAQEFGVTRGNADLDNAIKVAKNLRAEGVRRFCNLEFQRKRTQIGDAEKAAEKIEAACTSAIKVGVSLDHPKIQGAKNQAQSLREEESLLKRLAAAEKRKQEREAKAKAAMEERAAKIRSEMSL